MVDIQCAATEIRRGKKEDRRKKPQGKNIMVCPITSGDHNKDNCHNYEMTTCIYMLSLTARLKFPVEAVCLIELGKELYS